MPFRMRPAGKDYRRPLWAGSRFTDADCSRATYRALRFIYRAALDKKSFAKHGDDYLWCFYTISASVQDACLRRVARRMGVACARRWRRNHRALPQNASPEAIIYLVFGNDAAESLNVYDDALKEQLKRAASHFSARDFLMFDALSEPPPSDVPRECLFDRTLNPRGSRTCRGCKRALRMRSRYDVWSNALIVTYVGDRSGVELEAHYDDVLKWLPIMRPYGIRPYLKFHDTVYAITHLVYTLNEYNAYKLLPRWLPQEYDFLKASFPVAIARKDDDMLGEIMDSLRAFGMTNEDEIIRAGMEHLLSRQSTDGGWGDVADKDIYSRFHQTWCAITALSELATQEYSSRLKSTS